MKAVRTFGAPPGPTVRWWAPFLAGAAAGLAAGVLLGVRRGTPGPGAVDRNGAAPPDEGAGAAEGTPEGAPEGAPGDRAWVERAWAGAMENLARARERLLAPEVPDLDALRTRLAGLPGGDVVRIRHLGDGIVEVVGSAPDETAAATLLDAVAAEPGVEVVVNRVWTPSSAVHNVPGL